MHRQGTIKQRILIICAYYFFIHWKAIAIFWRQRRESLNFFVWRQCRYLRLSLLRGGGHKGYFIWGLCLCHFNINPKKLCIQELILWNSINPKKLCKRELIIWISKNFHYESIYQDIKLFFSSSIVHKLRITGPCKNRVQGRKEWPNWFSFLPHYICKRIS